MKQNYHKLMVNECESLDYKPRLLLHVCCAICAATALTILPKYFDVYVYFYNPNIQPHNEYIKRYEALEELIRKTNSDVTLIDSIYDTKTFLDFAVELKDEPEGGIRCHACYDFRLLNTYNMAKELKMDYYATAITQSPMKNVDVINNIGLKYSSDDVKYLVSDFKKNNGLLLGNNITKEHGIYRQNFCGCSFAYRGK